jgi:hypothetical protein
MYRSTNLPSAWHSPSVSVTTRIELPGAPMPTTRRQVQQAQRREFKSGFWQVINFEDRFFARLWGTTLLCAPDHGRHARIAGAAAAALEGYALLRAVLAGDCKTYFFDLGPKELSDLQRIAAQGAAEDGFAAGCKTASAMLAYAANETPAGVPVTFDTVIWAMTKAVLSTAAWLHNR